MGIVNNINSREFDKFLESKNGSTLVGIDAIDGVNVNNIQSRLYGYKVTTSLTPAILGSAIYGFIPANFRSVSLLGVQVSTRNTRSVLSTKSIGTTEAHLLTVRNRRVYRDQLNQVEIEPIILNLSNNRVKTAVFFVKTNSTLINKNYSSVGQGLVSELDTSAASITNGDQVVSITVAKGQTASINLRDIETRVPPTLTITVSGFMTSGSTSTSALSVSLTYYEDI